MDDGMDDGMRWLVYGGQYLIYDNNINIIMRREHCQPINPTIESIIHKSMYGQSLLNIHTDIKKLMLDAECNNRIFDLHNLTNNNKGFRLSEINYQLSDPKSIIYPKDNNKQRNSAANSSKSLNTSTDWRHLKVKPRDIVTETSKRDKNLKAQREDYQKGLLQQKNQGKFESQRVINTKKHKSQISTKRISRFLFEIKIPQSEQSLTYKVNKFKLIQNNQQSADLKYLKADKNKNKLPKTNHKKQPIPQFIKPSLQLCSQHDQNYDKKNTHFKFDLILNKQPTNPKQSSLSLSKRVRYAMKSKKYAHKQKQEDFQGSIATQPILKPKVDVLKLSEKIKGDKQSKIKYQKYRQATNYLIKHKRKKFINVDQDINLCGWQYRDNNFNDILQ